MFVGVPCIYPTSGAMNPSSSHSQNDEGTFDVVVSLGIADDFELSATLQCVVTLQCQNCSVPVMERMELQSCSSDAEFTVPEGVYIISGTIYTDCGEVITVGPLTKDIGKSCAVYGHVHVQNVRVYLFMYMYSNVHVHVHLYIYSRTCTCTCTC